MIVLGPQPLHIVFEDGQIDVLQISLEILAAENIDLGDGVSIEMAKGEIIFEYDDDIADRRLLVTAPNTLALVGTAIMLAEADITGMYLREGATVHRHLPGDVKGPGDMFR